MADEANNQPAGVVAGQPAGGSTPPAADPNRPAAQPAPAAAPADKGPADKAGEAERQGLRERAIAAERELEKVREQIKQAEDAKLAEKGEWQKLAQNRETEAKELRTKYEKAQIQNSLYVAGHKADVKDVMDLAALANLGDVDVNDPRALVAAAEKAVADLKTAKPYLFGTTQPPTTTPAADPKTTTYPTPQANPGGSEPFDPSKVTADDVRSGKLTREQLARVAGNGVGVDFMGRPLR